MSYDKIYKDNIVSGAAIRDGKGNRIDTMYLSKDEFNTFNPAKSDLSNLTEGGFKVIKDNSGSGLEVCDIGMALYVDETKGLRRYLNGQIVDVNTNTQAFLNRLKDIKTTNPDYFTTEDNWQAEALLNIDGYVYKFVLNYADDGETVISVRLPKYPDYVEVDAGNVAIKGNGMTLGLTDGTTNLGLNFNNVGRHTGSPFISKSYGTSVGTVQTEFIPPVNDKDVGITTDPTKSGIVGTLTQTKLKLRYFIQVATGSETENNIVNDIELNNPYSLFDYKYSPFELNNISWLRSNGQWNAKSVYPDAYNKLLKVYNGTETVEGLSVKLSTESYTNYDFVINTSDETFRLPIDTIDHPINSTGTLPVKGNGMAIGLTDGNGHYVGTGYNTSNDIVVRQEIYGKSLPSTYSSGTTGLSNQVNLGITTDSSKSGIVADLTSKKANLYLYFYVGETVQNANLIDAGRIGEVLPTKTDKVQAAQASMPSSKYINLTLGASGSNYTAPANGYFCIRKISSGAGQILWLQNASAGNLSSPLQKSTTNNEYLSAFVPAKKSHKVAIEYTLGGATQFFRFIYAEGEV